MGSGTGRGGSFGKLGIPGVRALRRKLPALREPEGLSRALLTAGGAFGAAYGQMKALDRWGTPGSALGQGLIFATILRLVRSALRSGPRSRRQHGDLAYQHAFYTYLLPAAGAAAASLAHIVTVPGPRAVPLVAALAPGLYLVATGAGLWLRTMRTLGVDTASAVYVYFPEEGRQIRSGAYGVLRHPLYAAVSRMVLGIALLRGRLRSMLLALMALGFFHVAVRFEERELEQRFGRSYEQYEAEVPALIPDSIERERQVLNVIAAGDAAPS